MRGSGPGPTPPRGGRGLVLTVLGSGRLRPGSGTWGSLATLPALVFWPPAAWPWAPLAVAGAAYLLAWMAGREILAKHPDPSWCVIDESCGLALAFCALPAVTVPGALAAFAAFRLFDIAKPWPLRRLERLPGVHGVMLDDVAAGALAAATVAALASFGAL